MIITPNDAARFGDWMRDNEKSPATIAKYLRDVQRFMQFAHQRPLDKALIIAYKTWLASHYLTASANSMLASLNAFLRFCGWSSLCVKQFRMQRRAFVPEEKELTREEYQRLVDAARKRGNERLELLVQTICATGIRVSELEFITVEAVRRGEAVVRCKGKTRSVFLVRDLRALLLDYIHRRGLAGGPVFVTRNGRPVSRTTVWREMKSLCAQANVAPEKVYPHNLRHLFARVFYAAQHDLAKLADVLGHSSLNTTRIYVASTGQEHRRRMEDMHLVFSKIKKPPVSRSGLVST